MSLRQNRRRGRLRFNLGETNPLAAHTLPLLAHGGRSTRRLRRRGIRGCSRSCRPSLLTRPSCSHSAAPEAIPAVWSGEDPRDCGSVVPDVYRGLPVFVHIAEATGMVLKIALRDENPDIMDEFLLNGTAQAIPVAVFYTRDHQYLTHWTERPAVAHAEIDRLRAAFAAAHPTVNLKAPASADTETIKTFFAALPQQYPSWQVETVREVRELLAATLAAR